MKTTIAIILATLYLLAFIVAINIQASESLVYFLFAFSPVMLIGLALTILRDRGENYPEMKEGQEWGYFHN
ncbi:hypothetical protein B0I27_105317 [Arcticibacter pallidicorallinus]|uniref:Uncharacterized protein n=1 Tax=Arcticibacter pallidicorallinus TaxID=1259464 RepID=A0A2T0U4J0_9SPHI|nr:hypothetical protein [Arcticibacter pallidicorallinus]PRY52847.1 hypothetical protein B0I27_105317 [Arcticibacter pallidicorallinus]